MAAKLLNTAGIVGLTSVNVTFDAAGEIVITANYQGTAISQTIGGTIGLGGMLLFDTSSLNFSFYPLDFNIIGNGQFVQFVLAPPAPQAPAG